MNGTRIADDREVSDGCRTDHLFRLKTRNVLFLCLSASLMYTLVGLADYRIFAGTIFDSHIPLYLSNLVYLASSFIFICAGSWSLDRYEKTLIVEADRLVTEKRARKTAFSEAREIGDRFKTYVDRSPNGVFLVDGNGDYIEVNESACRITGYAAADLLSKNFLDLIPDDMKEAAARYFAETKEGRQLDIELDYVHASGERRSWKVSSAQVAPDRFLCYASDTTEQRNAQAALHRRILALTLPLDSSAPPDFTDLFDIDEIQEIQDAFAQAHGVSSIIGYPDGKPITKLSNPCRLCRDLIQTSAEGFAVCCESDSVLGGMFDESAPVIMPCLAAGLLNAGVSIVVGGKHIANWIIGEVRDARSDIDSLVGNSDRFGIDRSSFREALSEVSVMSREEFAKIARLLHLFARELSGKAYQNIQQARFISERDRAEDRSRESLRSLSTLMTNLPGMSYRCANDEKWTMEFVSDGAPELTGYAPAELVGNATLSFNDIIHPDDRAWIRERFTVAVAERKAFTAEYRIRTRSGVEKWVWEQGVAVYGKNGEALALEGFITDVTERNQAREDLETRNAQLDKLTQAAKDLNSVLEYPVILRTLVAAARELVGAEYGLAGRFEEGEFVFTELNSAGKIFPIQYTYGPGIGIPGHIAETGRSYFTNDAEHDPYVVPEHRNRVGFRNCAGIPIHGHDGGLLACFLAANRRGGFSEKEIALLEGLAASAANALSNASVLVDLRRAERQLRESRGQFQILAESAPVGIFLTDASGGTTYVNPKWCNLSGIPAEEAMGYGWLRALHPDDRSKNFSGWRCTVDKGDSGLAEYRFLHADGRVVWVMGQVVPEIDQDGKVVRYIGTMTDITEHIESEKTINALNTDLERRVEERTAQLKSINAELEAFSYSVSHDLRAPLRAIEGFSSMIEKKYAPILDAEGLRLFGVIRRNTVKMNTLIGDILSLSRIGTIEMKMKTIDMEAMVLSTWFELMPQDRPTDFVFTVDKLPPALGDPSLVKQIWVNLLSNAVKYSAPSPVHRVEAGFEEREGRTFYFVRDSGVGFDEDYAGKLFGPFQRLHSSEQFEGTGVGLALVKRIVSRHGGMVRASGKPGAGAVFSFSLSSPFEKTGGI